MVGVKGKTGKYKHTPNQLFKKGHKINNGRKQTKAHIEKTRKKLLGHKTSKETRKKIGAANSIALKKFWKAHPEYKNNLSQFFQKGATPWNKGKDCPWCGVNGFKKGNTPHNKGMIGYLALERHWNWQGGITTEEYGIYWTDDLKKEIRKRDKWLCQICGCKDKKLIVHHKDCDKKNCSKSNLITLCQPCHIKLHHKLVKELKNAIST